MSEPMNAQQLDIECHIARETLEPGTYASIDLSLRVTLPEAADDVVCSPGQIIVVGHLDEQWSAAFDLDHAIYREQLSEALLAIIDAHDGGASAAGLVVAPGTQVNNTNDLITAIESLNQIDMPLYVVSCASAIDHRLLSQFATLSGGEYALLDRPGEVAAHAAELMVKAREGVRRIGFMTVEVPAMFNIEQFSTVSPQLGLIQLSTSARPKNSISFPVLCVGTGSGQREFFMRINTPPLAEGRFHLSNFRITDSLTDEDVSLVEQNVSFNVFHGEASERIIASNVSRVGGLLDLTMLIELIAQAYLREDGGSISQTLKSLEANLLQLGLADAASRIANLRVTFLHRGSFALPELNESWRIVYSASTALLVGAAR